MYAVKSVASQTKKHLAQNRGGNALSHQFFCHSVKTPTLLSAFTSLPDESRSSTTLRCPFSDARWSAVHSSCKHENTMKLCSNNMQSKNSDVLYSRISTTLTLTMSSSTNGAHTKSYQQKPNAEHENK